MIQNNIAKRRKFPSPTHGRHTSPQTMNQKCHHPVAAQSEIWNSRSQANLLNQNLNFNKLSK